MRRVAGNSRFVRETVFTNAFVSGDTSVVGPNKPESSARLSKILGVRREGGGNQLQLAFLCTLRPVDDFLSLQLCARQAKTSGAADGRETLGKTNSIVPNRTQIQGGTRAYAWARTFRGCRFRRCGLCDTRRAVQPPRKCAIFAVRCAIARQTQYPDVSNGHSAERHERVKTLVREYPVPHPIPSSSSSLAGR